MMKLKKTQFSIKTIALSLLLLGTTLTITNIISSCSAKTIKSPITEQVLNDRIDSIENQLIARLAKNGCAFDSEQTKLVVSNYLSNVNNYETQETDTDGNPVIKENISGKDDKGRKVSATSLEQKYNYVDKQAEILGVDCADYDRYENEAIPSYKNEIVSTFKSYKFSSKQIAQVSDAITSNLKDKVEEGRQKLWSSLQISLNSINSVHSTLNNFYSQNVKEFKKHNLSIKRLTANIEDTKLDIMLQYIQARINKQLIATTDESKANAFINKLKAYNAEGEYDDQEENQIDTLDFPNLFEYDYDTSATTSDWDNWLSGIDNDDYGSYREANNYDEDYTSSQPIINGTHVTGDFTAHDFGECQYAAGEFYPGYTLLTKLSKIDTETDSHKCNLSFTFGVQETNTDNELWSKINSDDNPDKETRDSVSLSLNVTNLENIRYLSQNSYYTFSGDESDNIIKPELDNPITGKVNSDLNIITYFTNYTGDDTLNNSTRVDDESNIKYLDEVENSLILDESGNGFDFNNSYLTLDDLFNDPSKCPITIPQIKDEEGNPIPMSSDETYHTNQRLMLKVLDEKNIISSTNLVGALKLQWVIVDQTHSSDDETINNVVTTISWDNDGVDIDDGIWVGFNIDPATAELINSAYLIGTMIDSVIECTNDLKTIKEKESNFDKYYDAKLAQIIVTGITIGLMIALTFLYVMLSNTAAYLFCLAFVVIAIVALVFESITYTQETSQFNKTKKYISLFKKQDLFKWVEDYSDSLLKYISERYKTIYSISPIATKKDKAIEILGSSTQVVRQKTTALASDREFNVIYGKDIDQDTANFLKRFNDSNLYNQDMGKIVNGAIGFIALLTATITAITTAASAVMSIFAYSAISSIYAYNPMERQENLEALTNYITGARRRYNNYIQNIKNSPLDTDTQIIKNWQEGASMEKSEITQAEKTLNKLEKHKTISANRAYKYAAFIIMILLGICSLAGILCLVLVAGVFKVKINNKDK